MVEIFNGFRSLSFSRGGSVMGWGILGIEVLASLIARGKFILQVSVAHRYSCNTRNIS